MPEIQLGDRTVQYHIERQRRKTISASISHEGTLLVSSPYIVPEFVIRNFLKTKQHWILDRLQRHDTAKESGMFVSYTSGEAIPFFDSSYILTITKSAAATRPRLYFLQNSFQAILPENLSQDQSHREVKTLIHDWYKRNTLPVLQKRVDYYKELVGVEYTGIRVKDVTSHWGSCSSKRNLNFNYRLAMLPIELSDYIIVHELCHIKEMNHSARFWNLVGNVIPNYKELRAQLKRNHMFLD